MRANGRSFLKSGQAISSVEQLRGHSITLIRGYAYSGLIQSILATVPEQNILYVDRHLQGLKMIKAGRTDYFIGIGGIAKSLPEFDPDIIEFSPLKTGHSFFVLSKKNTQLPTTDATKRILIS